MELIPGNVCRDDDLTTLYWVRDGQVFYRHYLVRGAHFPTFRFYLGGFAKDQRNCYRQSRKLIGASPSAFRALNFAYAADDRHVWTWWGKAKEADATIFAVCDDGVRHGDGYQLPAGYGKDKNRVFYMDAGKPSWVRQANPEKFVSLKDAHFGKDDSLVFCGRHVLQGVRVDHWTKIGGYYSKDDRRVYYFNRQIRAADHISFEVVPSGDGDLQLARDKCNCYWNDNIIVKDEFLKKVACPTCFENRLECAPTDLHCLTSTVVSLAQAICDDRAFNRMPVLADALEDAGCANQEILGHCRGPGPHVRACWVLARILAES
jgi:hypothetical protein